MASLEQTVKLILAGENRVGDMFTNTGGQIESLGGKMSGLNDSVADVTAPFASLTGGVLKADAALAALAAGGLTYAFAKSKDFESASIELKKVLGDHPAALAEAESYARRLSQTYGESATEILLSTADFKQAGYNIEEAMSLTKTSMDLVIAGSVDASQASDLLIASLKGFGLPATEAARLIDILNEISNNYATDVEQLAIGMAELSPIASTMGYSLEGTAGVLTPVIEIFRSGSEAAVALKTGLLRLVDDNPTIISALDSIGVAQHDANDQLRSGKDILLDVGTAYTTLDEDQKLFIASQLVGINQAARMVTVFDNLNQTTEITATAMNAAGSAANEVAARLESAEVAVNRFQQGFIGLATTVGDQFRIAAKEAIDGGTDIEHALTSIVESGALDDVFAALESELSQLGAFLSGIAEDLPAAFDAVDFSGLLQSLGGLGDEIEGLFDGIDLSTPEGLAEAIQKVIGSIEGLTNMTAGMVDGAGPFIRTLMDLIDEFINLDDESQKSIGSVTGFAGALNKVTGPIGSVLKSVAGVGSAIQLLAGVQIVGLVSNLVGSGGLSSALTSVVSGAGGLIAKLAGPAGVAAVVGASAVAVGGAVKTYLEWQDAEDELEKSLQRGVEASAKLADRYREISEQTGEDVDSTETFHRLISEGTILLDQQNGVWVKATEVQRDYAAEVAAAAEESFDMVAATEELAKSMGFVTDETKVAELALKEQREAIVAASAAYYEFLGNTPEIARMMAEIEAGDPAKPISDIGEAAKEASEKSDELMIKLEELANNEKIRAMELSVDIDIAQIEADTTRIERAFDSIDSTIAGTGDQIMGLIGMFSDLGNSIGDVVKGRKISEQVDLENKRRDDALNLQKELTQAEIDLIDARTDALRNGDSMITISGDGLAPELEAFMWKILESIQVRASGDQSQFLLGI